MRATRLRQHLAGTAFAAGAVAGCNGADPSQSVLIGEWASESTKLIALSTGAEIRMPCDVIGIEDAIELSADSTFSVRGGLQTTMAVSGSLPTVRVTGHVDSTRVNLRLAFPGATFAVTQELEAGAEPLPVTVPVCPQ